jgi:hypothetical protein
MENPAGNSEIKKNKTVYLDPAKMTIGFFVVFVLCLSGGIWWLAFNSSGNISSTSKPADSQLSSFGGVSNQQSGQVAGVSAQGPFGPVVSKVVHSASPSASPAPTFSPTQAPTAAPTSAPTDTPNPTSTATPTPSPLPSATPTASPSASPAT